MSGPLVNTFMTYAFIRRLVTPFDQTDAFKFGLIDAKGKRLRSPKTGEERDVDGPFDRLIMNLKRALAMIPGGSSPISSWAAAAILLRERTNEHYWKITQNQLIEELNSEILRTHSVNESSISTVVEDAAANCVGGGNIASVGIGVHGEPPGPTGTMLRRKKLELFTRWSTKRK